MESLSDPWEDRVAKNVPRLAREKLTAEQLWTKVDGRMVPDMTVLR